MSRWLIAAGLLAAGILAAALLLRQGGPAGTSAGPSAPSRSETKADAAAPTAAPAANDETGSPAPLSAAAPRKPGTLTLAAWSLRPRDLLAPLRAALAPVAVTPAAGAPVRPAADDAQAWRTTFGAERRDLKARGRDASGLTADVVALSGVTHMQDVVRTFTRRDYFAVLSRQLLVSAGERPATPTTALAIQRSDGLRVALQEHLLLRRLRAARPAGEWPPAGEPAPASEPETIAAAATAVRLIADGKPLWLVSVDFSADCADPAAAPDAPDCPAHAARLAALTTWFDSHRDGTLRAIVAGTGAARIRAALQPGDDVRVVAVVAAAGCAPSDASLALVREPTAPPLAATNARLIARGVGERCPLLADLAH